LPQIIFTYELGDVKDHSWEIVFYLLFNSGYPDFLLQFFFSRLAFYKGKSKQQSQQHPVSVIICQKTKMKILPAICWVLVQKYSLHEVIVVNDNSVDDSKYILRIAKTFKLLQIVNLKQEAKLISGKNTSVHRH